MPGASWSTSPALARRRSPKRGKRIGDLHRVEAEIRWRDPAARRAARQERSTAIIADLEAWPTHHLARVATKSPLSEALKYIAEYLDGLCLFLTDGGIERDNNTVERTIRPIALNRENALFAGHDAGAENWAVIATLIETCKLNAVEPCAWLAATLSAIAGGHMQSRVEDLLPWNDFGKV